MSSNKTVILKKTKDFNYILVKITREECEEIQALMTLKADESDKYPFIQNVEGCAHVTQVTEGILREYISEYHTWKVWKENSERDTQIVEYTCYANTTRNPLIFSSNVIIHEDRMSAFKCACLCLNAQYFYIVKELNCELPVEGNVYGTSGNMSPEDIKEMIEIFTNPIKDESTDNSGNSEVHSESTDVREAESDIL